jgi:hypothetical protein
MAFDYINALLKKEVTRTPIWVMRQAGRYLPEYRATRKKAGDFLTLCKSSDLACEVTLQPLDRFDLDAAILFSDILTIPDAMGLGLHFVEGEGPKFTHPLNTLKDIEQLQKPDVSEELSYVSNAGILVVDMPPEEAADLKKELDKYKIDLIFLVAPTTTDERLEHISKIASGYIYYVSLKGVTGAGNLDVDSVNFHLKRMRNYIQLPVGVGFGIKDAETAKQVGENADAVIVGSALVSIVEELSSDKDKMVTKVGNLAKEISSAIT